MKQNNTTLYLWILQNPRSISHILWLFVDEDNSRYLFQLPSALKRILRIIVFTKVYQV